MELEKSLNEYLEKIDTSLNPMTACERVDSVKEIKSEMLELLPAECPQNRFLIAWEILRNLLKRIQEKLLPKAEALAGVG